MKAFALGLLLGISSPAMAVDCDSDCGQIASFTYPCPTPRKPWRKCEGREPTVWASCQAAKSTSCELWSAALDFARDKIKPHLEGRFNSRTWMRAQIEGKEEEYMLNCVAAGVAVCGALGTELSGPWGGAVTGGLGTFVSWRLCKQSQAW